jgi:hypothetical protein
MQMLSESYSVFVNALMAEVIRGPVETALDAIRGFAKRYEADLVITQKSIEGMIKFITDSKSSDMITNQALELTNNLKIMAANRTEVWSYEPFVSHVHTKLFTSYINNCFKGVKIRLGAFKWTRGKTSFYSISNENDFIGGISYRDLIQEYITTKYKYDMMCPENEYNDPITIIINPSSVTMTVRHDVTKFKLF